MKTLNILFFSMIVMLSACKDNSTEKHQNHRNKIIDVSDKIVDIKPSIIFGESLFYIVDQILIVSEISPKKEKGIHLFNKNTFEYITSTGILGRGPGEIAMLGTIGVDKKNRILWVQDNGNKVMWKFPLDSILKNKNFMPTINLELRDDAFINRFGFLNDSIVIGKAVKLHADYSFDMEMSKLNIKSNAIEKYGYENPKAIGKNSNSLFSMSIVNNFYVNCYYLNDLMTICDLDGNLKCNVYGPDGLNNPGNKKAYFFGAEIFGKYIVASYIGDIGFLVERERGNSPSKFLVFDMNGDYKATIETRHKFGRFCVDEENKRVIAYYEDRPEALGYFNLEIE
jgi:hypothetical protein